VQVISKIDEGFTHQDAPFMVMAGHTARLGQWNRFDTKWRKGLRKSGLTYFHAKEHHDNPFALRAPKITDDNLMFGFVVRMDRADYQQHYRKGGWGGKAQPDSMYGLCFRSCLSMILQQVRHEIPRDDLELNFIVEEGHENEGAPNAIIQQLKRKRISGVSEFLGTVTTAEKKKIPGLQAADGLAFGAWYMDANDALPLGPPQKLPIAEPIKVPAMKMPIYRCHMNAEELTRFKEGYFEHVEHRRQFGAAKYGTKPKEATAPETSTVSGEQSS
jgi:hypothetical protein